MLHGRNNENILHKKEHFSQRKKNVLFLPYNMAAVQNFYKLKLVEKNRGRSSRCGGFLIWTDSGSQRQLYRLTFDLTQ